MQVKREVELVYVGKSKKENGSPLNLEIIKKDIKCDEMGQFSSNFYNNRGRSMRGSNNLQVNEYLCHDFVKEEITYQLSYVIFGGIRYTIQNILKADSRRKRILDIERTI